MIEKVFRDPVHNYIQVDSPVIDKLIDSSEVQRLRRIKQLGTSSFTFHGAEHSRFSHSLGAYELARRVCSQFEKHQPDLWTKDDSLLTMVAALLHDLGHGAYSHTFERLFDTNHEQVTQDILTNPETEVYHILSKVRPNFPEEVASVISHTHPNKKIVSLISSQIDVDRMDYLLRDSYYTGASYGQLDLTYILRNMCLVKNGIAFNYKGMHAVEDYIIRRFQMYVQVYFHPASRAIEGLLQNLLKRAKDYFQENPHFFEKTSPKLLPFFNKIASLQDYLKLDDGVLTSYIADWMTSDDAILSDLASRFINRRLFKSLKITHITEKQREQLEALVAAVGFDTRYYTFWHKINDLPYDIYHPSAKHPRTQIEIIENNGKLAELSTVSSLVSSLSGKEHGDERFYFPKEMLNNEGLFQQSKKDFQTILKTL